MKKKKERAFNPKEIKDIDIPIIIKGLEPFIRHFMPIFNMMIGTVFRIYRRFGKFFGRLIGFIPENEVIRLKECLIELKDGCKLATDVYLPKEIYENRSKGPTVLIRLPYWKDFLSIIGHVFASKGYITILQDVRGTGHSIEYGTIPIFISERDDGLETLQWISKRFWYNGKIGMWGISYLGLTQLAVSWDNYGLVTCFNPSLCCYGNILWHPGGLIPIGMTGSVFFLMLMIGFYRELLPLNFKKVDKKGLLQHLYKDPIFSLYNEPIKTKKVKLSEMAHLGKIKFMVRAMGALVKAKLDISVKDTDNTLPMVLEEVFFRRAIKHDYEIAPYCFGFDYKLKTPMLVVGGWKDMFIEHFMRDLKLIQKHSPDLFKTNFKVIIGPWAHLNLDKLLSLKEDLIFLQNTLPFWWFEHWLKNEGSNLSKIPPLRLYILNKGIWRNFKKWPPDTQNFKLYLHSNGKANSKNGDGVLSEAEPKNENPDKYTFDPSNPIVMKGGRNFMLKSGLKDQSKIEEREDVLVYTSEKLEKGIEVIGEIKAVLYASSSALDTDFMVKLVDVSPNGKKARNIVDSGIRARFRDGNLNDASLIEPNKIYKYEIMVGSIAIYFPKDHRIRIEISSSHFPRFDVNSNLGGENTGELYKIADQTIYHDKKHPSHLILPKFL